MGVKKKELFFGQPYRAGDDPEPGAGSVEAAPHNPMHNWCGDPREPNREDMGAFYSAARDPLFYSHHANVDRLWTLWSKINRCPGFADETWLNASFLFYDEEARLVRVRVRDCVDTASLRYTYQDVGLPWLNAKPSTTTEVGPLAPAAGALPATLNETVRLTVTRPRVSRSQREKEYEEEVLVLEGIEIAHHSSYVKFDVYISKSQGGAGMTAAVQCAGRVALMPHVHGSKEHKANTTARFGIGEVLEEIGANGDTTIIVSLVPRCAGERVTVGGLRVDFVQ